MKMKVVVKVSMEGHKSRSKALQIDVGVPGVEWAALTGTDKNQIEVVGEGIDGVMLVKLLRKYIGYTDLVSIAPVEQKKDNSGNGGEKKNEVTVQPPVIWNYPTRQVCLSMPMLGTIIMIKIVLLCECRGVSEEVSEIWGQKDTWVDK